MDAFNVTPSPTQPPAEVIEQAIRVISVFDSLGPLMALLLVVALALVVIVIIVFSNRNASANAITVLANTTAQKDKELAELKEQRRQEHEQFIESLGAIADQGNRANDLSEKANEILRAQMDRGLERDANQKKFAEDFHILLNTGSKPVREILERIQVIAEQVKNLDARTADWPDVLKTITPLLIELGALRQEAKKHSTQPIPVVDAPANGAPEASPT